MLCLFFLNSALFLDIVSNLVVVRMFQCEVVKYCHLSCFATVDEIRLQMLAKTFVFSIYEPHKHLPPHRKPESILKCEWTCIYTIVFCV